MSKARPRPPRSGPVRRDDRGISTVLNYVLALFVVALLTSAVFVGVSGVVQNQHERATHSSMEVVGHQLASDLRSADRLADAAGSGTVRLTSDLPDRAAGSGYTVSIRNASGDRWEITVRSTGPDASVVVTVGSSRTIRTTGTGTFHGGTLVIRYDPGENELVVSRAAD